MSLQLRTTDELVRIAESGAGFRLNAHTRPINDLVRIAYAASASGAQITFYGLNSRTTDELVRIGNAGKGSVILEG